MTIDQLIESLNLAVPVRMMVRSYLAARYPGMLGKILSVKVDSDEEVVTACLDGEPFLSHTFADVEAFFNGDQQPESEQPDGEVATVGNDLAGSPADLPEQADG